MMMIDFPDNKVLVRCAGQSIMIDPAAERGNRKNWLYIDGRPVNPKTYREKEYKQDYVDKSKSLKRRIKTINDREYVLVVDISPDNKVFFLWFYKREYNTFRGSPSAEWSYHEGKWYEKDRTGKHKVLRMLA